jgi:hypothetical protein
MPTESVRSKAVGIQAERIGISCICSTHDYSRVVNELTYARAIDLSDSCRPAKGGNFDELIPRLLSGKLNLQPQRYQHDCANPIRCPRFHFALPALFLLPV